MEFPSTSLPCRFFSFLNCNYEYKCDLRLGAIDGEQMHNG